MSTSSFPLANAARVVVIGGGPAGLMAAEIIRAAGHQVHVHEAKGSVGRKFLIAGKGGLNLTHSDPPTLFASRYRERAAEVGRWLRRFDADALREWARGLGVETFVGSSGRVFPNDMKAAPLLRGWVRRLREQGVVFHVQHRWLGWTDSSTGSTRQLRFETADGEQRVDADAVVLAMGGASWPQLGSDGHWQSLLQARGVAVAPLKPANCGFDIDWSEYFIQRHAGAPLKAIAAHTTDAQGRAITLQGECVVSADGIEGSLVYALSAGLRDTIEREGSTVLHLDLLPNRDPDRLRRDLARPRNGRSLSEHLRRQAGISGVKAALLYEVLAADQRNDVDRLAATLKRLPLRLQRPRPVAEAISSAGGVRFEALDEAGMITALPGVFAAGEMLDWEAPTGGYLLTACFASGECAGRGVIAWLRQSQ
ncbi:TIGR03862 family flavoprotein [Pseudoxanthomonas dokdonensis]|uniref:NAD(FAD)-utilizing dehydrogenase n=1 Tax=Pseudoxanthomonas dokdonensis TaxID=344882 RepID=A0A0R0CHE4_9GAMM|nr:TIGR03862 family flavoprotein [Pseudoxanthomonas dokdonensis]KRG68795.1 NAD(FAD)-utilizing dehydrogenase [Pseudoxanthomonas dokdonensis]